MIFTPPRLLGEMYEIRTGDRVMVVYPTPHREEEAFGLIRVGLSLVTEILGFFEKHRAAESRD